MDTANPHRPGTGLGNGAASDDPATRSDAQGDRPQLKLVDDGQARLFEETRDDHFAHRDGKAFAGIHLIIDVVDGEGLDDQARIERAMKDCVDACGATLIHIHTHRFSPLGVSGVAVLAESHISVHTWPEVGFGAFDVFMCGATNPWKAVEVLRKAFNAGEIRVKELLRGEGIVDISP